MHTKIVTEKEFNNIWFRTGKDPDGNDMLEIIIGEKDNNYRKYALKKQNEEQKLANRNTSKTYLDKQIKFKNVNEQPLQTEKLYIWRSKDDSKVRSEHELRDDETFDWNSDDIKPGEDYGCRCYAEFLDENGNPNGKYGRITWPEKGTESNPKPYFEPSDKNGIPLNEKPWKELTNKEKELRKQEELEKFKNSDRLRENIREAQKMIDAWLWEKGWWFKNQVKAGGPWDYKKDGHPEMEHVGNFNYGATGAAAGIPEWMLERGAGWQQEQGGAYDSDNGHWWGIEPYGDDPIDQYYINEGIDWYDYNY